MSCGPPSLKKFFVVSVFVSTINRVDVLLFAVPISLTRVFLLFLNQRKTFTYQLDVLHDVEENRLHFIYCRATFSYDSTMASLKRENSNYGSVTGCRTKQSHENGCINGNHHYHALSDHSEVNDDMATEKKNIRSTGQYDWTIVCCARWRNKPTQPRAWKDRKTLCIIYLIKFTLYWTYSNITFLKSKCTWWPINLAIYLTTARLKRTGLFCLLQNGINYKKLCSCYKIDDMLEFF